MATTAGDERIYFDMSMGVWVARVVQVTFNGRPHWRLKFFGSEAAAR